MNKINRQDIKRKIEILTLARDRIKLGNDNYICFAIRMAVYNKSTEWQKAGSEIIKYIDTALNADTNIESVNFGSINTLGGWQLDNMCNLGKNGIKMRDCRMQWIDWMINCYKEDFKV